MLYATSIYSMEAVNAAKTETEREGDIRRCRERIETDRETERQTQIERGAADTFHLHVKMTSSL